MTLESDLLDLASIGVQLRYLRSSISPRPWEALVSRALPTHENTLRYAVGFASAVDPSIALDLALEALERDPQLTETALIEPTCDSAPAVDLRAFLANLRPTPPKFTRRLP